ncbi:hypothetical protein MNBD_CHLOROFLEXI01-5351 [hydrothermal vent metagenome]|uniref:Uncharacterized protein n=1 Tax=hydrothermal vent metagenome TaxID=652676 RepID=A0A3B0VH60_9ZZZZ
MKKLLKKALIWFPILFVGSIIGLEAYTRNCNCVVPETAQIESLNFTIPICESDLEAYPLVYNAEQRQMIDEIIEQRNAGEPITKETYRAAMDALVYEASPELLGRANGVVCRGEVAFIRDSLPPQAKLYVARHEVEHLFQTSHENQEVAANIAAGKAYSVGLLSTIVASLIEAKSQLSWCCFLKSSWFIFKLYFLGIGG